MKYVLPIVLGAMLSFAPAAANGVLAQGRPGGQPQPPRTGQQQKPPMQNPARMQQMDQLRAMTSEAARIRTRAEQLAANCAQDQTRTRNQTQMRLMQQMSDAVGSTAREHERIARSLQDLIQERDRAQDRDRDRDRDMDRDMDRIRQHLDAMTNSMNETLTLMERMHDRLRTSDSSR
ncbi:MAG: hypothetical protein ACM3SQ_02900 [Betaproteobacteria bacterium]